MNKKEFEEILNKNILSLNESKKIEDVLKKEKAFWELFNSKKEILPITEIKQYIIDFSKEKEKFMSNKENINIYNFYKEIFEYNKDLFVNDEKIIGEVLEKIKNDI